MIPIYIAFAAVVLTLIAVIAVLCIYLVRQQAAHIKQTDTLYDRLMTHTWEEFVVHRQAEKSDQGARPANWKPGDADEQPPKLPEDINAVLGGIR